MISFENFIFSVNQTLEREISEKDNLDQFNAIKSPPETSLYIVAGPGSGKTTVMALRALKMIYVDDISPSSILVTTFTKKAASELRSRILGWGDKLRESFIKDPRNSKNKEKIESIDFNQIITGTLDSISENVLREYREPGTAPPVVIEDFIANTLMIRFGLFKEGRFRNDDLIDYIAYIRGSRFNLSVSEIGKTILEIKERFHHDGVDREKFLKECNPDYRDGVKLVCDAIADYESELESRLLFDYAKIEEMLYKKLKNDELKEFTEKIQFLMIDEYQDTNLLQEKIYFELARSGKDTKGSITVVGDDDQSLYRFRGATVDLFVGFPQRIKNQLGIVPKKIDLMKNYRSTENIVNNLKNFILLDNDFQRVRVKDKKEIIHARKDSHENFPVICVFRNDIDTLATDLSEIIYQITWGKGLVLRKNGRKYHIKTDSQKGSPADLCLLCSSPQENKSNNELRLPGLIRLHLGDIDPPIEVFNPRGQKVEQIPIIEILCGLILECIDPDEHIQNSIRTIPQATRITMDQWRIAAHQEVQNNRINISEVTLEKFLTAWQNRKPLNTPRWRREVSILDLAYQLVSFLPEMQTDIEGLVYLEVITRTITQSSLFTSYGGEMLFDKNNPDLEEKSIKDANRGIFIPLASGAIEINEDLLETLPKNRFPIMSIHQAKGLEFPVVIVDVGSDFRRNHHTQSFKRFPTEGGRTCNLEDELRPSSPLKGSTRSGIDRAFDDLIRQYFVAYSRPQDVLILGGLTSLFGGIPHVATGWDRHERWHWGPDLPHVYHYNGGND